MKKDISSKQQEIQPVAGSCEKPLDTEQVSAKSNAADKSEEAQHKPEAEAEKEAKKSGRKRWLKDKPLWVKILFWLFCAGVILLFLMIVAGAVLYLRYPQTGYDEISYLSLADQPGEIGQIYAQAEQGDREAMLEVGLLYYQGQYTAQDSEKAAQWWEKAGDAGNMNGYYNLGVICRDGDGVPKDLLAAKNWFEKAAEGGQRQAMMELSKMYFIGIATRQDTEKGLRWMTRAAEAGDSTAMFRLGTLYSEGQYVEKDGSKAVTWFQLAAENNNTEAMNQLATYAFAINDYNGALYYWQKAAELENGTACYNLAVLTEKGLGVDADESKATSLYQKAAELGNPKAMDRLGLQAHGEENYASALRWWTLAAEQGDAEAMHWLASLYAEGKGVEKNEELAQQWQDRAKAAEATP